MRKIILSVLVVFLSVAYCLAQSNLSPSEKISQKFQAISDKICWEVMLEQNQIAKEYGEELPKNQLKMMAEKASSDLMQKYKNAFIVSESEAKELLAEKYNDLGNRQEINNSIKEFSKLSVMLPMPIQYLIEQYNQRKLEGLDLEFAARLFKEYLK